MTNWSVWPFVELCYKKSLKTKNTQQLEKDNNKGDTTVNVNEQTDSGGTEVGVKDSAV